MKNIPSFSLKRGAKDVNGESFLIDKTVEKLITILAIFEFPT